MRTEKNKSLKIPPERRAILESLLEEAAMLTYGMSIEVYYLTFLRSLDKGTVTVKGDVASSAMSRLVRGEALAYVTDILYPLGVTDTHLASFYRAYWRTLKAS